MCESERKMEERRSEPREYGHHTQSFWFRFTRRLAKRERERERRRSEGAIRRMGVRADIVRTTTGNSSSKSLANQPTRRTLQPLLSLANAKQSLGKP